MTELGPTAEGVQSAADALARRSSDEADGARARRAAAMAEALAAVAARKAADPSSWSPQAQAILGRPPAMDLRSEVPSDLVELQPI